MKLYGNLNNRLEENKKLCKEIKVGTHATMYGWSDRQAYEVVDVIDQNHIKIRRLKAIRTDKNGMSDCQSYRYESDPSNAIEELKVVRGKWNRVSTYAPLEILKERAKGDFKPESRTPENIMKMVRWYCREMTEKQWERYLNGETVVTYQKLDSKISFGVADEYFDYSF